MTTSAHRPTLATMILASRRHDDGSLVYPEIPQTADVASLYDSVEVVGEGTLYSYTVFHPSSKTGLPPYGLAYVDFPSGARVFGRLELDAATRPRNGSPVEATACDDVHEGFVFRISSGHR